LLYIESGRGTLSVKDEHEVVCTLSNGYIADKTVKTPKHGKVPRIFHMYATPFMSP